MPELRRGRLVVLALVLLALVIGGATWALAQRGLPDDVAVRVGETDVTKPELAARARSLRALYGVEKPRGGAELDSFRRDLAKSEVLALMVARAAESRDLEVTEAEARASLDRYVAGQYGDGGEGRTNFDQALADAGTSEAAVLEELRRQLVVTELYDAVTKDVAAPDDAAIDAAFDARRCLFPQGPQRRVAHLVTASRAEADDALRRVRGGEPFAAVAREVSLDGSSAEQGGDLGFVARNQLDPAFAELAFGTPLRRPFGPVQTQHGWNLGVATAARPAVPEARIRSEATEPLRELLLAEARSDAWRGFVADLLRRADADYATAYRPAKPHAAPTSMGDRDPGSETDEEPCG